MQKSKYRKKGSKNAFTKYCLNAVGQKGQKIAVILKVSLVRKLFYFIINFLFSFGQVFRLGAIQKPFLHGWRAHSACHVVAASTSRITNIIHAIPCTGWNVSGMITNRVTLISMFTWRTWHLKEAMDLPLTSHNASPGSLLM